MHVSLRSGRRIAMALGFTATLGFGAAHAQGLPGQSLDPADQLVLRNYTLTQDNVTKLNAAQRDADAKQLDLKFFDAQTHSIDAAAATLDREPGAHALLAAHGLTAREGVLTALAAGSAMMSIKLAHTPYASKLQTAQVNPANVAFVRAHMAEFGTMLGQ